MNTPRFRFSIRLLSAAVAMAFAAGPVGAAGTAGFSIGDEKKVGEKIQSTIRQEFTIIDEPDIDQYIGRLGREILAVAGPQYFDYRFFVVSDREFNAFAAPSGLVFINSGLVEAMDSEDELVGVIAHEIGHVDRRHIADRVEKGTKVGIGTAALILAGIALGGGELSEAVITGAMATGASMNLKFSRENEEEADRQAYSWMVQMGRDPRALLSMLGKMRRISILKTGKIPPYLLTHPAPEQRMDYVQDLLHIDTPGSPAKPADAFAFARFRYRLLAKTRDTAPLLPLILKKSEKNDDEGIMARYGLSQLYMADGNYTRARGYLEELTAIYPGEVILKTDLGVALVLEGKPAAALELFREAHRAAPEDAYTTYNLARALEESGETGKAIELYQAALGQTPTFARLHYYLGRALTASGRPDQGHYHNGVFSWLEGNIQTSRYHLQKAMETLPAGDPLRDKTKDLLDQIKKIEKL